MRAARRRQGIFRIPGETCGMLRTEKWFRTREIFVEASLFALLKVTTLSRLGGLRHGKRPCFARWFTGPKVSGLDSYDVLARNFCAARGLPSTENSSLDA